MKLQDKPLFRIEDYPDSPEWFQKAMTNLNGFMEFLYSALNKNLDELNINMDIFSFTATPSSDFPLKIKNRIKGKPRSVLLCQREEEGIGYHVKITNATTIDWEFDGENIVINSVSGLTADTKYRVTILVM